MEFDSGSSTMHRDGGRKTMVVENYGGGGAFVKENNDGRRERVGGVK